MKKMALSLVVGAALALTPMSSFALTAMSDANMKDATGQAGVTIVVDDITLYQTVGESMYIDTDGVAKNDTDAAGIVITGKETFTTIRALLDYTDRGGYLKTVFKDGAADETGYKKILDGTLGNRYNDADNDGEFDAGEEIAGVEHFIELSGIGIDVAAAAPICTKINGVATAAVVIAIPTIEICKTGDTQDIGIAACDATTGNYSAKNNFIRIEKEASVLTTLGGTLEIAAH